MSYINDLRNFVKNNSWLLVSELVFLSLMIVSLPSLEAPKNIFLVFFVITATIRQFKARELSGWGLWDWLFSGFIFCAFLSTIFAGYAPGNEWSGFRMLLTYTSVGWLLTRAQYSGKQISWLFWLTIASTIPPLIWGLIQYVYLHTKHDLQLNSVGHVNHSAIYLTIIFGSSVGALLSYWSGLSKPHRIGILFLSTFFYIGLIVGESRGALGTGILLAVANIILFAPKSKKIKLFCLVTLVFSCFLMVLFKANIVQKQINYEKNNDVLASRNIVWNVPIEAARFYPILGIGMNNWKYIKIEEIERSVKKRGESFNPNDYALSVGHSHNLYLQTVLERGIIGLLSLLLLMSVWMNHLLTTFKESKNLPLNRALWAGSFSAWAGTFGIGLVNSTFHHEHGILACLFLGFYVCITKTTQNKKVDHPHAFQ